MEKILIVEDEQHLQLLKQSLEDFGIEILTTTSGSDAHNILKENSDIKLIVSDIAIPDMSGLELRKKQLEDPKLSHIPMIFLTSNLQLIPKARESSQIVLTKPVNAEDFSKVVRNILATF